VNSSSDHNKYNLYDDPFRFYNAMLSDIESARNLIFLETYRFNNDLIGVKFRDVLEKKSREGVEIKILMDSWGTSLPSNFFSEIVKNGGEIRYFKKIKFFWDFFTKNHRRNHRKLLLIDDTVAYIGSANITNYSLNWKESMLRMEDDTAKYLRKVFLEDFGLYNKYVFEKPSYTRTIKHNGFEIIRDVPSMTRQRIRKKYVRLVKEANHEIIVETPYFLPGFVMRKAMSDASKRGVDVKILIPKHSDVGMIDLLRSRFIGQLHKNGISFFYYLPHNLHAKLLLIDKETFSIGSPNFDYRSFRFQHEICIVGENKEICKQIDAHATETLNNCEGFDYEKWSRRPLLQKFFEWLLLPLRHFF